MLKGAGEEKEEVWRMSHQSGTELRHREETIGSGLVHFICRS